MTLQKAIEKISKNPKKLFLIDGFGALLSAFLLGVVLVEFEDLFGIPRLTLYVLASFPCFFAAYDFYCYLKIKDKIGRYLKGIATANLLYCVLSIGLAFYHLELLSSFAWIYIVLEIIIVIALALFELKTAIEITAKS